MPCHVGRQWIPEYRVSVTHFLHLRRFKGVSRENESHCYWSVKLSLLIQPLPSSVSLLIWCWWSSSPDSKLPLIHSYSATIKCHFTWRSFFFSVSALKRALDALCNHAPCKAWHPTIGQHSFRTRFSFLLWFLFAQPGKCLFPGGPPLGGGIGSLGWLWFADPDAGSQLWVTDHRLILLAFCIFACSREENFCSDLQHILSAKKEKK